MLRYPIYVRSVTNLSDARYCAGMGVEMLGFSFDPSSPDHIGEHIFHGITGWLSGIKTVAEFNKVRAEEVATLLHDIKPDYVLADEFNHGFEDLNVQVIYSITVDDESIQYPPKGSMVLLAAKDESSKLADYYATLKDFTDIHDFKLILSFGFNKDNIDEVYKTYNLFGFSLRGGTEISPGLKNFDELAEILEAIEE